VDQNATAENWLNLGWCYCSAGLVDEAERCVKQINRRTPSLLPTLMLEAAIAERRNNFDKALTAYDGAIAMAPSLADPHFFKASLLNHTRRFSEAEAELVATYNLDWINPNLQHAAIEELEKSRHGQSESQ
jgi:tetratricopeptide (TPR) repeat protein